MAWYVSYRTGGSTVMHLFRRREHAIAAACGFLNRGYLLTFAQQHNKPSVWPEWCDSSAAPNQVDAYMITQFANLFASVQGPGNTGIIAHGYWDRTANNGGLPCALSDYPAKKIAFGQAFPNGFKGTHYNGTYWLQSNSALIPMPNKNHWQ